MADRAARRGRPCQRCGKLTEFEAIGGRRMWRSSVANWVAWWRFRLARRWRPWHLECLQLALEEYGTSVPSWAHIRKRARR